MQSIVKTFDLSLRLKKQILVQATIQPNLRSTIFKMKTIENEKKNKKGILKSFDRNLSVDCLLLRPSQTNFAEIFY